ncbi:MAG: hypothetical protein AAFO07_02280 [Bacteroidota bacterium]
MKWIIRIIFQLIIIGLLTILTQVGGVAYLLALIVFYSIKAFRNGSTRKLVFSSLFLIIYSLISFVVVPPVAEKFGRVPMPVLHEQIKPAKWIYVLTNRHYVDPKLKETILDIGSDFNADFPECKIFYLDANFPFLDDFPLLPHLSHSDGKKLDLGFCYYDKKKRQPAQKHPGWLGYGLVEEPYEGEVNQIDICDKDGYWQYKLSKFLNLNLKSKRFAFDTEATYHLISIISKNSNVKKIFLEPHLKSRLGLKSMNKVRFQGCHSVRHDDHIHLQI